MDLDDALPCSLATASPSAKHTSTTLGSRTVRRTMSELPPPRTKWRLTLQPSPISLHVHSASPFSSATQFRHLFYLSVFTFLLLSSPVTSATTPEVVTTLGAVRGRTDTVLGKQVTSFLGIPYAEAPIGERRFRAPEKRRPWSGVLNADKLPNTCPQARDVQFEGFSGSEMWNPNTEINEDCLYLNIWVPGDMSSLSDPKTVMLWIFGGGFVAGTNTLDLYDGRILAAQGDVIVVSIQYRIGALGFLYLGEEGAPGSQGLIDQQLALQWVKDNVDRFGGNPEAVTIFGESAGACSVLYHLLSPSSADLFQYGILESVGVWSVCFKTRSHSLHLAHVLARDLNCPTSSGHSAILNCLRNASWEDIINNQFAESIEFLDFGFVPTIDGKFLEAPPWQLLAREEFKKTSILLGSNANEGIYWLIYAYPHDFPMESVNLKLSNAALVRTVNVVYRSRRKPIRDAILFEYGEPAGVPENGTLNVYLADQITSDSYFLCPTNFVGEAYADAGQHVYMYHLTHRSSTNPWPSWTGVPHGYEIEYLFGQPLNDSYGYTFAEKKLSRRVIAYITNFAKTGNPNYGRTVQPSWPKYSSERKYLQWDITDKQTIGIGPHATKCKFWGAYLPSMERRLNNSAAVGSLHQVLWLVVPLIVLNQFSSHSVMECMV